jgi:NADH:ubiquinone oxidoreductase subunit H
MRVLYALLAVCVAALIYLKGWWESMDLANLTPENIIALALVIAIVVLVLIFISPYLGKKRLPFLEGKVDSRKIYGGNEIKRR